MGKRGLARVSYDDARANEFAYATRAAWRANRYED